MQNVIDLVVDRDKLVASLKGMRNAQKPGHIAQIYAAMQTLRGLPFPDCYIDGVRDELMAMLGARVALESTSLYLSFYGDEGRAAYLKVGIAKSVRSRMAGIATGNPLPRLWTYSAQFYDRQSATGMEAAILAHLSGDKVHGEWVYVKGLSEQAASAFVADVSEFASDIAGRNIEFSLVGF